ncbi:MAG: hypothetical protein NT124_03745 [Candidatus Dependentiae bacterium]|nr:hypothetical protein [Candidatus Dependentiae bacterium]
MKLFKRNMVAVCAVVVGLSSVAPSYAMWDWGKNLLSSANGMAGSLLSGAAGMVVNFAPSRALSRYQDNFIADAFGFERESEVSQLSEQLSLRPEEGVPRAAAQNRPVPDALEPAVVQGVPRDQEEERKEPEVEAAAVGQARRELQPQVAAGEQKSSMAQRLVGWVASAAAPAVVERLVDRDRLNGAIVAGVERVGSNVNEQVAGMKEDLSRQAHEAMGQVVGEARGSMSQVKAQAMRQVSDLVEQSQDVLGQARAAVAGANEAVTQGRQQVDRLVESSQGVLGQASKAVAGANEAVAQGREQVASLVGQSQDVLAQTRAAVAGANDAVAQGRQQVDRLVESSQGVLGQAQGAVARVDQAVAQGREQVASLVGQSQGVLGQVKAAVASGEAFIADAQGRADAFEGRANAALDQANQKVAELSVQAKALMEGMTVDALLAKLQADPALLPAMIPAFKAILGEQTDKLGATLTAAVNAQANKAQQSFFNQTNGLIVAGTVAFTALAAVCMYKLWGYFGGKSNSMANKKASGDRFTAAQWSSIDEQVDAAGGTPAQKAQHRARLLSAQCAAAAVA